MVRDADAARVRLPGNVELAVGDLRDPAAVDRAMAGITRVLLVSPVDPEQVAWHRNVVRAAEREGAYIVKISGLGTYPGSFVDSGRWHAETEAEIEAAGLPHAFLHPLFFFQNLAFQLPLAKKRGVIRSAVGDARIAMIDVRDISAVAAALLASPQPDQTLVLTSREACSYTDVARAFAAVLGRDVVYEAQQDDELAAALAAGGQPEWHVRLVLQFNRAFREGMADRVTDDVERVLQRAPLALADYVQTIAAEGAGDSNPFPT